MEWKLSAGVDVVGGVRGGSQSSLADEFHGIGPEREVGGPDFAAGLGDTDR
jgi:hypothetical protein